jgi:hypothetical protein
VAVQIGLELLLVFNDKVNHYGSSSFFGCVDKAFGL